MHAAERDLRGAAALELLEALPAIARDPRASAALTALVAENSDDRERLERISALQAFQTRILEAIASGVITFGAQREITSFNHTAAKTFGVDAQRWLGRPADAMGAVIPDFPELFQTYFATGAVQLRAEVDALRADGTPFVLAIQFAPLDDPGGTGIAMVIVDVTEQRRLEAAHQAEVDKARRVQETFSRYLAPHVVASLMHDPGSITLGGERRRATMFFADVRGFTRLASTLSAERVVEILNAYFDEAVRIVFAHDGLLDKFYGDGLMAVFGPPAVRDDDAARAVAAAIALREVVPTLGPRIDYPLEISVGLATGDVVAGHFGSAARMDYTVIGDAVNLANGLQAAAPPGSIYCDEETFARASSLGCRGQRVTARVKGRSDAVTAFSIFPFGSSATNE